MARKSILNQRMAASPRLDGAESMRVLRALRKRVVI
jgi:hypothetical protein